MKQQQQHQQTLSSSNTGLFPTSGSSSSSSSSSSSPSAISDFPPQQLFSPTSPSQHPPLLSESTISRCATIGMLSSYLILNSPSVYDLLSNFSTSAVRPWKSISQRIMRVFVKPLQEVDETEPSRQSMNDRDYTIHNHQDFGQYERIYAEWAHRNHAFFSMILNSQSVHTTDADTHPQLDGEYRTNAHPLAESERTGSSEAEVEVEDEEEVQAGIQINQVQREENTNDLAAREIEEEDDDDEAIPLDSLIWEGAGIGLRDAVAGEEGEDLADVEGHG